MVLFAALLLNVRLLERIEPNNLNVPKAYDQILRGPDIWRI